MGVLAEQMAFEMRPKGQEEEAVAGKDIGEVRFRQREQHKDGEVSVSTVGFEG